MVNFFQRKHPLGDERGFSFIEVTITLAIVAITGAVFMRAMTISSNTTFAADQRNTATNLAESQMEYVKSLPFAGSYTPNVIPPAYAGYSASIDAADAAARDPNIQLITVTISNHNVVVMTLQDCKVRR